MKPKASIFGVDRKVMGRKKLLLIWGGRPGETSYQLFKALNEALSVHHDTLLQSISTGYSSAWKKLLNNVKENIARLPRVIWADAIIIHSYASLSIITVVAARLLLKKVVLFHWDVYPTTMRGQRRSGRMRRLADALERLTVALTTTVVVPSADFVGFVRHRQMMMMPLWTSIGALPLYNDFARAERLQIAFVGQLDISRGVEDFVAWVEQWSVTPIEFHIFAGKQRLLDQPESDKIRIVYHPKLERQELLQRIATMHLGLISLSRDLDQPGFPSKVFDYVAANVPVVYFGRPLPAFCELVITSGVGEVLLEENTDLPKIRKRLMSNWSASRAAFLNRTTIDIDRLSGVL